MDTDAVMEDMSPVGPEGNEGSADWASLPQDILSNIASQVPRITYTFMLQCCNSWNRMLKADCMELRPFYLDSVFRCAGPSQ